MRVFRTDIQVRGYELDGYGHVNHAVYLNYAEHARWRMIEESAGTDYFKRNGVSPVVVRAEIDYRDSCYLGEWVTVETSLVELKTRIARFRHRVLKKDNAKLAAELLMSLVVVGPAGRAVQLPADFGSIFG